MGFPELSADHLWREGSRSLPYIISVILIVTMFPLPRAQGAPIQRPTSDYGVYPELDGVLAEIESNRDSPEIIAVTEERLEKELKTEDVLLANPSMDFEARETSPQDPYERTPSLYHDMEEYENLYGKNSILDFLMDRGVSNYYIYTRYRENYKFTRDFWRPVLVYPMDLETGKRIDIDDDPSTGDPNGEEVFISLSPIVSVSQLPSLIPFNRTLVLKMGLRVNFELLAPVDDELSIQIIKYISYEGKNYLVNVGLDFGEDIPSALMVELYTEKVNFKLAPGEKILEFIDNYIFGNGTNLEEAAILSSIQGPYLINYELPTNASDLVGEISVPVGLTEIIEGQKNKISWVVANIRRAEGRDHIPVTGNIRLNSPGILHPMDHINWEGYDVDMTSMKCDADLYYYDEADLLTYAVLNIVDLPGKFNVKIDYSKTVNGTNVTPLEYRAEDIIGSLMYRHTQFEEDTDGPYSTIGFSMDHVPESFDLELTTDINREMSSLLATNTSLPILTAILDSIIGHVIARFSRIGRMIGGMADGMTDLPARKGWMKLDVNDDGHFGTWEFFSTDGEYMVPSGGGDFDYITFLNTTDPAEEGGPEDEAMGPISGRITGISHLDVNFSNNPKFEAKLGGRDTDAPFRMLFLDGETYFKARLSNLPNCFRIEVVDNGIFIGMSDGSSDRDLIKEMNAVYFDGTNFIRLNIEDVPGEIWYREDEGTLEVFSAVPFGSLEFYLSNDTGRPFKVMEGNYVHLHQDRTSVVLSGRMHSLKHILYRPGSEGSFLMEYENETTFKAHLYNYMGGGSEAKVVIDPLPSNFSFDLPGAVGDVDLRLPDIVNVTGNADVSSLVTSSASVVESMITLASGLMEAFIGNIGGISQKVSFAYDLQEGETLDILGYFRTGDTSELDKVHWTHGISISQDRNSRDVGMEGKFYLQGMPKKGEISSNISGDDIQLTLSFDNWRPENHWLLVESFGVQDRDAIIYMNGLKTNIDFHVDVNFITNMSIGGKIAGDVVLDVSSNPGQLYVHLVKYGDTTSSTDLLLSSVPTSLRLSMEVYRKIDFHYRATSAIKYIYISNSRLVDGRWYHVNGLLHDVVEKLDFVLSPNSEIDTGRPVLIQGLPRFQCTTGSKEGRLDIYLKVDGRTVGQAGRVELFARDVRSISIEPLGTGSGYVIESTGLAYFSLEARDLPVMEAVTVNSVRMYGEGLERIEMDIDLFFGVYPVIRLTGVKARSFHLSVDCVMHFLSMDLDASISLLRISTADVRTGAELYNDRLAITSEEEESMVVPAPMLTLWGTLSGL